eukprot:1152809-Pelagomonas_calceolata.AAC.2
MRFTPQHMGQKLPTPPKKQFLSCRAKRIRALQQNLRMASLKGSLLGNFQRGLSENMPKYAPFSHLKCAHPQPFDLIGTSFALKCSWHYKLPEHMLRFV